MSTPIETAAKVIIDIHAEYGGEPYREAREVFASLAQHRDDIARAVLIARQGSDQRRTLAERVWQKAKDGEMSWDVRDGLLRDIDAVLAYLSGEAS